ncbi:MAG: hypothetical protein IPF54_00695 [Draconibacterium sp.]|nr:hypothetical protein [Draconibacterium sp.]
MYQSTCSLLNSGNGLNAMGTDKGNFPNLVAGKTDVLVPEAWGGNMDAGDWDRRINHLFTPRLYLELVELQPEYFKNLCLNIPESGNDLPDIVDEAIFGSIFTGVCNCPMAEFAVVLNHQNTRMKEVLRGRNH